MIVPGQRWEQIHIPAFRAGSWYRALDEEALTSLGTVSLLPAAMVRYDLRRARNPSARQPDFDADAATLRRAAELFAFGCVDVPGIGRQSPADLEGYMLACQGVPARVTRYWLEKLASIVVASFPPSGRAPSQILTSLPANTFLCLEAVAAAFAQGDTVFVRPSLREPLSAARFVAALLDAGASPDRLSFCPMSREAFRSVLPCFERAVLYGGDELRRLAVADECRNIEVRGPGRAVALVSGPTNDRAVDRLVEMIGASAGRLCTNVRAVLVAEGGDALAERLAKPLLELGQPDAPWPLPRVVDTDSAKAHEQWIRERLHSDDRLLTPLDLRGPVLGPCLIRLARAEGHPLFGAEFPFPFATVTEVDWPPAPALLDAGHFTYEIAGDGEVTAKSQPRH